MKERVGGVFLLQRVQELLKPDQERSPKIIPEPPGEQTSRPGGYLPVIIKDGNSRMLEVAAQPSEPGIFFDSLANQGGTAGVPLVPIYNVWTRGFFIESEGGAGGRSPLAGGSGEPCLGGR